MSTLRAFAGERELSRAELRDAPVHWPRPSVLDASLAALDGVGPKLSAAAAAAGIRTVGDVLLRFPHRHRDRQIQPLAALEPGSEGTVLVEVLGPKPRPFRRGRLSMTSVKVGDESGSVRATWFNQPWVADKLAPGVRLLLTGKVSNKGMAVNEYEVVPGADTPGPRVLSPEEGGAAGEDVLDPPAPVPPARATSQQEPPVPPAPAESDEGPSSPPPSDEGPPSPAGPDDTSTQTPEPSPDESASPAGGVAAGVPHSGGRGAPEHMGDAAATGPAGQDALSLSEVVGIWPVVLDKLTETAPALAATFEGARPVSLDDDGLKIGFPADKTFNKRKAESPERREALAAAFVAVAGQELRPTYVLLDEESAEPAAEAEAGAADHNELVERLKSEFNAEEVS